METASSLKIIYVIVSELKRNRLNEYTTCILVSNQYIIISLLSIFDEFEVA